MEGALHLIGHCFGRPGVNTMCSVCDANPIFGRATWAASILCYPLVFSMRVGTCSRKTWCDARANKNRSSSEIGRPCRPCRLTFASTLLFSGSTNTLTRFLFPFFEISDKNNIKTKNQDSTNRQLFQAKFKKNVIWAGCNWNVDSPRTRMM